MTDIDAMGATPRAVLLLRRGGEPLGPSGFTPLMLAASGGDAALVEALLPLSDPNDFNDQGGQAWDCALKNGFGAVALRLVALVDPNLPGRDGATPLIRAAKRGWAPGVAALAGVSDLAAKNIWGSTALMRAASETGNAEAVAILLDAVAPKGANLKLVRGELAVAAESARDYGFHAAADLIASRLASLESDEIASAIQELPGGAGPGSARRRQL